ncbi:MAG TPA: M15 family metallopeptidase [Burkholderiaceae bacterium]|nr:M15 family metallopeptidase [Burkholderiaceae bacterium]
MIACEDIAAHPAFQSLRGMPEIALDLRYATPDNFVSRDVYGPLDCAFLRREAAEGLQRAAQWLQRHQPRWQLCVFDALRPQRVQEALYAELAGTPLALYLAHPQAGSLHSFGVAVDAGLLDEHGAQLDMGSGFDEMCLLSHPDHEAEHLAQGLLTAQQLVNRGWLRAAMRAGGFHTIATEWWHFEFGDRDQARATLPRVL